MWLMNKYTQLQNAHGWGKHKCQKNGGHRQKRVTQKYFVTTVTVVIKIVVVMVSDFPSTALLQKKDNSYDFNST